MTEPVTYLTGADPAMMGALVTPEGLVLTRGGPIVENIYPFVQEGEPDVSYHSIAGTGWMGLFQ